MLTPDERVRVLLSHRPEGNVKGKARDFLKDFVGNLDKIRELAETDDAKYKQQPKDANGIDSLDINELDARENARIEKLKRVVVITGDLDEEEVEIPPPVRVDKKLLASSDINAKGRYGYTKLMAAVVDGNAEEVKRLLAIPGINKNITDRSGISPLEKAWDLGYTDIAVMLGGTIKV